MDSPKHILLIEDEQSLVFTLQDTLENEGYTVHVVMDGNKAVSAVVDQRPDLILLDLMLPGKSGFDICKEIRERKIFTPIIMLTARDREMDKVKGLDIGADDYVTKPFSVKELLSRIHARLRTEDRRKSLTWYEHFDLPGIHLDLRESFVKRESGTRTELTTREVELVQYFLNNINKAVSREQLLENVWRYEHSTNTRTVDVHISKLRSKIEPDPEHPKYLVTLHGVGYMFKHIPENGESQPSAE